MTKWFRCYKFNTVTPSWLTLETHHVSNSSDDNNPYRRKHQHSARCIFSFSCTRCIKRHYNIIHMDNIMGIIKNTLIFSLCIQMSHCIPYHTVSISIQVLHTINNLNYNPDDTHCNMVCNTWNI